MVAFLLALFNAIAAVPSMLKFAEEFAAAITLWFVQRANNETNKLIVDAAAMAARASTQEERYAAVEKWKEALSRTRVTR